MSVVLIHSNIYLGHKPPIEHPERPSRINIAYEALRTYNLLDRIDIVEPDKASVGEVLRVHSEDYVKLIERVSRTGGQFIDGDTYVSSDTFDVALYAVGGVLKALNYIIEGRARRGFALVRPPGHHAGSDGKALGVPSQGFCIFNNVAIASRYLQDRGYKRIAIVDVDVHHGNGTQEIFQRDNTVLYISLHQDPETLYPGTGFVDEIGTGDGEGYTVNIPLPPGSSDDVYVRAFNEIVKPILEEFKPDFILVSTGFDTYYADPLGDLNVSTEGFRRVFSILCEVADKYCNGRLLGVLEGGYGAGLARAFPVTIATLANIELKIDTPTVSRSFIASRASNVIERVRRKHKEYWKSL